MFEIFFSGQKKKDFETFKLVWGYSHAGYLTREHATVVLDPAMTVPKISTAIEVLQNLFVCVL